ncbi:MAG: phenylalanine--tRNA ligase subunit beta [Anaerolinea sp.]|nr:phenylalanine--tRNA ligase subunit beta [Anaerolinea sp.]
MLVPISWLKEYVDITVPVEALAERMTAAGMEVAKITYYGLPQQFVEGVRQPISDHLVWDREKLVLGAIREVKPHPNADKLVIAMVDYGGAELEQTVTGAPNLFEYKGLGVLSSPLWTGFALEGAEVWDGHSDEPKRMILKEKPLRGIPNRCMVCSAKELGMSDEHDGIILMHDDPGFPPGTPLQDVLGDIVLEVELTPNLARAYSILGIAREVAALLGQPLREPSYDFVAEGAPVDGTVSIDIREPSLNPRFTFTLLRDTQVRPSPEWMQRRLNLVGQRPINNIVDVTNYVMFEIGQPLHAYDYDKLVARANGSAPNIITRLPEAGEVLETLDGAKRQLDAHNILVCDTAGVIGLGGIMGGADTEISDATRTVLLEAAAWNFINVRRSMQTQNMRTEAGIRFSRGVHPSWALRGSSRGIELMRQTGGGQVARGVVDVYPLQPELVVVQLPLREIRRISGVEFTLEQAADLLTRGGFTVQIDADSLNVGVPDTRMDIGTGIVGQADLIEEICRIYGYGRIANTIIADAMPPQRSNPELVLEERTRDLLVGLGLQEIINYRLTTPEREAELVPPNLESSLPSNPYIELANPIALDKTVMRKSLLTNAVETAALNARYQKRQALFEIGAVYLKRDDEVLPDEPRRLSLLITGERTSPTWQDKTAATVDFYDLKGIVEALLDGLHITGATYERATHTSFHPGRSAALRIDGVLIGTFGELHPLVAARFDLTAAPVMLAEFDLDELLAHARLMYPTQMLPVTPPVLQDIALIVSAETPAADVERVIVKAGGSMLKSVRLFDVYQGDPIPAGFKSLAYSLTYQTDDKTLTDREVAKVQEKIVKLTGFELGAKLRS